MKTYKQFLLEREYQVYDNIAINEMANISKTSTRLPCKIYISDRLGVNHGPRIKVNADYSDKWSGNSFTITISDTPTVIGNTYKVKESDIEEIKDWILLNKDILLKYWKEEIDTVQFIERMRHL
jgi:hypothetical protein